MLLYKVIYFPEPYSHSKNKIKVQLVLPIYAAKSKAKCTKKADMASLKLDVTD